MDSRSFIKKILYRNKEMTFLLDRNWWCDYWNNTNHRKHLHNKNNWHKNTSIDFAMHFSVLYVYCIVHAFEHDRTLATAKLKACVWIWIFWIFALWQWEQFPFSYLSKWSAWFLNFYFISKYYSNCFQNLKKIQQKGAHDGHRSKIYLYYTQKCK